MAMTTISGSPYSFIRMHIAPRPMELCINKRIAITNHRHCCREKEKETSPVGFIWPFIIYSKLNESIDILAWTNRTKRTQPSYSRYPAINFGLILICFGFLALAQCFEVSECCQATIFGFHLTIWFWSLYEHIQFRAPNEISFYGRAAISLEFILYRKWSRMNQHILMDEQHIRVTSRDDFICSNSEKMKRISIRKTQALEYLIFMSSPLLA